jgi:PTS system galactitol-specific IIC component
MEAIINAINFIKELGPTVMMPIMIFILALILGAKPGRAFRAAVTIGIAFVGINLVIGLMWTNLGNAAQAMVERTGVKLDVIDVGWPSAAAIAFGGTVGTWIIPLALLVNIIMLAARLTKTLNIDIWNFWHFAFTGSLVYVATGNLWLGLTAAALNAAIALFLADWTAPAIQNFYSLPGISIPHGFSAAYVPLAIPLNKLLDMIPGVRDWKADPETIRRRFGVFGEPIVIGVILGAILGILAGYNLKGVLQLSINLGAVMLLLPTMVKILMEGLIPVSEAARDFMAKRFAGREFRIGLDSAILIGHESAIATALILVPITIALAIGLSTIGLNRILPFADLAVIPFMVCMIAPITRGNIVRGVIIGTVVIAIGLMLGTTFVDLHTKAAIDAKFTMPAGATLISSICDGTNPLTWTILQFSKLSWLGMLILLIIIGILFFFFLRNEKAWVVIAGAPKEVEKESS